VVRLVQDQIDLCLVEGPFKRFRAAWRFTPLSESACEIVYTMHYEFATRVIGKLLEPLFDQIADKWVNRSPLGWSMTDATAVGQMCCFLLSDWSKMTSGELIHVDGGYHAMGTDIR